MADCRVNVSSRLTRASGPFHNRILQIPVADKMDGRVLQEALVADEAAPPKPELEKVKSDKKITDEELLKILELPLAKPSSSKSKNKKKKKKPAKKAAKAEEDDDDDDEDDDSDDE